ncbi:NUDIX hydrolase [Candidatus Micrarchaeota archaeon]|nr:NUDIX hydrolase [Candidatus Micrarchaeota archaeon]
MARSKTTVRAVIFDQQGRVLLLQYSDHYHHPRVDFTWTLPSGGMDKGEDAEVAVARELHEETGLRVVSARKFHEREFVDRHGQSRLGISFVVEADGDVRLSEEHQAFKWVPVNEIEGYDLINEQFPEIIVKGHELANGVTSDKRGC